MLPVAPAGTGQPPSSPKLDSKLSTPASSAASTLASPWPRVLWKWAVAGSSCPPPLPSPVSAPGAPARRTRAPAAGWPCRWCRRSRSPGRPRRAGGPRCSSTRSTGTRPSYGQPKDVEMTALAAQPRLARPCEHDLQAGQRLAIERLTFLRLWVSDADMNTLISSKAARSRADAAFAQLERRVQAALVGDQHRDAHFRRHVDPREHLCGVGQLRDHVGAHEARHLQPAQAGARERVDQLDLALGGDRLGLVLKAVARTDLPDGDRARQAVLGRAALGRSPLEAYTRPPCPQRLPTRSRSSAPRAPSASVSRCVLGGPACRSRSARATRCAPRRLPSGRARQRATADVLGARQRAGRARSRHGHPQRALPQPLRDARPTSRTRCPRASC